MRGAGERERFSAQWRDPVVAERLQEAGLDDPALLGASFLADAPRAAAAGRRSAELDDEHPYRISRGVRTPYDIAPFVQLMQIDAPQRRFFESELVRRLWPEPIATPRARPSSPRTR
jgi:hypothetical protein